MIKLENIEYAGKKYPVTYKQSPNWSHTAFKKQGLVLHTTTSNSFLGGESWLLREDSNVSALFIVGRTPGEITQLGDIRQKLWHAGRIHDPHVDFQYLADMTERSGVNPNEWLDGIEFVGGVDENKDGKVTSEEVNFTEWQYTCAEAIAKWHAEACGYQLDEWRIVTHEDIASYKSDLKKEKDELRFRLFDRPEEVHEECLELQVDVEEEIHGPTNIVDILRRIFCK